MMSRVFNFAIFVGIAALVLWASILFAGSLGSSFFSAVVNWRVWVLLSIAALIWFLLPADQKTSVLGTALLGVPYLWLLALFLIPFFMVLKISMSDAILAIPPYGPTMKDGLRDMLSQLDFENFVFLTTDDLYWKS